MYRTAIFCFYDKMGVIGEDDLFLLKELNECASYVVVVVNGELKNRDNLQYLADKIIYRKNTSYDAGAYKEALLKQECREVIEKSDELILCNNSFWGPFVHFSCIFKEMEKSKADFWGLTSTNYTIFQYVHSFFLVYRKVVLKSGILYRYFEEHIDKEKMTYFGVYAGFENGLSQELIKNGFQYDAYVKNIFYSPYADPYESLALDRVPILKKKIYSDEFYHYKKAAAAFSYITRHYTYPSELICQSALRLYKKEVTELAEEYITKERNKTVTYKMKKREEVQLFLQDMSKVYIYGTGYFGQRVFAAFFHYSENPLLGGFLISDKLYLGEEREFLSYPLWPFSEKQFGNTEGIIVALSPEHSEEVFEQLKGKRNIFYLWEQINN